MKNTTHAVRAAALLAAGALALTACSSSTGSSSSSSSSDMSSSSGSAAAGGGLKIGSLLPLTGSLAFLGPPEVAGVNLAIKEINDAGGVLGSPVEHISADSSDADHADVAPQSWTDLQSKGVSAVVGAASSSVTKLVVDDITNAKTVHDLPGQHRDLAVRLQQVLLPHRAAGHRPGLGAGQPHRVRRDQEARHPGVQRGVRHLAA